MGDNGEGPVSRREFLATTLAALGGCSTGGSGGGGQSTDTATGTATRTPTGTATRTTTQQEENTTTSEQPDQGKEITDEHIKYAESIEKSEDAAWYLLEKYIGGSTDINPSAVRNAEPGTKGEAAAVQVNPKNFEGGLVQAVEEQGDVTYSVPDMEKARNMAEYLSGFFRNDITGYDTAIALPAFLAHEGMPSNGIFIEVDGNYTLAHPIDVELTDSNVLNAVEGEKYLTGDREDIAELSDEEQVLGPAVDSELRPNGDPKGEFVLSDSKTVLTRMEMGIADIREYNDEYSKATLVLNGSSSSHRDTPALAMKEGAIEVTSHKKQPYVEDGMMKVRDMFGYFDIVDQVNEQVGEFEEFQDWDVYEEEGLPNELGAEVDSNEDNTEYDVNVDWTHNIDYNTI
jgi:hypothetical protein